MMPLLEPRRAASQATKTEASIVTPSPLSLHHHHHHHLTHHLQANKPRPVEGNKGLLKTPEKPLPHHDSQKEARVGEKHTGRGVDRDSQSHRGEALTSGPLSTLGHTYLASRPSPLAPGHLNSTTQHTQSLLGPYPALLGQLLTPGHNPALRFPHPLLQHLHAAPRALCPTPQHFHLAPRQQAHITSQPPLISSKPPNPTPRQTQLTPRQVQQPPNQSQPVQRQPLLTPRQVQTAQRESQGTPREIQAGRDTQPTSALRPTPTNPRHSSHSASRQTSEHSSLRGQYTAPPRPDPATSRGPHSTLAGSHSTAGVPHPTQRGPHLAARGPHPIAGGPQDKGRKGGGGGWETGRLEEESEGALERRRQLLTRELMREIATDPHHHHHHHHHHHLSSGEKKMHGQHGSSSSGHHRRNTNNPPPSSSSSNSSSSTSSSTSSSSSSSSSASPHPSSRGAGGKGRDSSGKRKSRSSRRSGMPSGSSSGDRSKMKKLKSTPSSRKHSSSKISKKSHISRKDHEKLVVVRGHKSSRSPTRRTSKSSMAKKLSSMASPIRKQRSPSHSSSRKAHKLSPGRSKRSKSRKRSGSPRDRLDYRGERMSLGERPLSHIRDPTAAAVAGLPPHHHHHHHPTTIPSTSSSTRTARDPRIEERVRRVSSPDQLARDRYRYEKEPRVDEYGEARRDRRSSPTAVAAAASTRTRETDRKDPHRHRDYDRSVPVPHEREHYDERRRPEDVPVRRDEREREQLRERELREREILRDRELLKERERVEMIEREQQERERERLREVEERRIGRYGREHEFVREREVVLRGSSGSREYPEERDYYPTSPSAATAAAVRGRPDIDPRALPLDDRRPYDDPAYDRFPMQGERERVRYEGGRSRYDELGLHERRGAMPPPPIDERLPERRPPPPLDARFPEDRRRGGANVDPRVHEDWAESDRELERGGGGGAGLVERPDHYPPTSPHHHHHPHHLPPHHHHHPHHRHPRHHPQSQWPSPRPPPQGTWERHKIPRHEEWGDEFGRGGGSGEGSERGRGRGGRGGGGGAGEWGEEEEGHEWGEEREGPPPGAPLHQDQWPQHPRRGYRDDWGGRERESEWLDPYAGRELLPPPPHAGAASHHPHHHHHHHHQGGRGGERPPQAPPAPPPPGAAPPIGRRPRREPPPPLEPVGGGNMEPPPPPPPPAAPAHQPPPPPHHHHHHHHPPSRHPMGVVAEDDGAETSLPSVGGSGGASSGGSSGGGGSASGGGGTSAPSGGASGGVEAEKSLPAEKQDQALMPGNDGELWEYDPGKGSWVRRAADPSTTTAATQPSPQTTPQPPTPTTPATPGATPLLEARDAAKKDGKPTLEVTKKEEPSTPASTEDKKRLAPTDGAGVGEPEAKRVRAESPLPAAIGEAACDLEKDTFSDISDDADDILNQEVGGFNEEDTRIIPPNPIEPEPRNVIREPVPPYDDLLDEDEETQFEEISDDELEEDRQAKFNVAGALDINWSVLVRDSPKLPAPNEVATGTALQRFEAPYLLARLGVSSRFARPQVVQGIKDAMKAAADEEMPEVEESKRPSVREVVGSEGVWRVVQAQQQEGHRILDGVGPNRRALCARQDILLRRKLCNLPPQDLIGESPLLDKELFKQSVALLKSC